MAPAELGLSSMSVQIASKIGIDQDALRVLYDRRVHISMEPECVPLLCFLFYKARTMTLTDLASYAGQANTDVMLKVSRQFYA